MTEKEMIEDMQKVMEYCCNVYDDKGNHIRNKCNSFDCEYYDKTNGVCCSYSLKEAKALYKQGYRKIPEGSVVFSKDELDEELETCKAVMIVSDEDGERYVSFEDYKEYTHRLGKIARQRKAKNQELEARIKELENLLDAKCDRCIESDRKKTAKEFFEAVKLKCKELEDKYSHLCKSKKECLMETCRYEGVLAVKRELHELAKQFGVEIKE